MGQSSSANEHTAKALRNVENGTEPVRPMRHVRQRWPFSAAEVRNRIRQSRRRLTELAILAVDDVFGFESGGREWAGE